MMFSRKDAKLAKKAKVDLLKQAEEYVGWGELREPQQHGWG
jgi:hypothetical protein